MLPAVAIVAAVALGRAAYPRWIERRQRRRRPLDADGIVRGAAPITLHRQNAPGVLLLHGGGDTPQVVAGLATFLHEAGCSVRVPLLEGHGREVRALTGTSARQWHDQVRDELEAMRREHATVSLVGLSVGGALAVTAAAERPEVASLVLLAPYVAVPPVVRRLADTSRYWGWAVPYFSSRGTRSIHDHEAASRTLGHGLMTPALIRALRDVVDAAWSALPAVRAPTLVVQSREDNRIDAELAEAAFARLGAREKKFVWTSGAGHVITVDFGYQRVFELTRDWLEVHRARSIA